MKTEDFLKEIKRQIKVFKIQNKYLSDLDKKMKQIEYENKKL